MIATRIKEPLKLIALVVGCQLVGAIGAFITNTSVNTWYQALDKPGFTPADWLFSPVWTTLYLLMAIAAYTVWQHPVENPRVRRSLILFAIQLGFNLLWTVLFFGLRSPLLGLIGIVVLFSLILAMAWTFFKVSRTAGWLMIPYLAWVGYATVLNYTIWQLND